MSNETRRLIINLFTAGYKAKFIAEDYSVPLPTVCSIVGKIEKIKVEKCGGNKRSLFNNEQKIQICSWFDENLTLTLKKLVSKAQNAFGFSCSLRSINRALGSFHYTLKRTTLLPLRHNCQVTI